MKYWIHSVFVQSIVIRLCVVRSRREMRCGRKIAKVCWKDRVSKESIRDRLDRRHVKVQFIKTKS